MKALPILLFAVICITSCKSTKQVVITEPEAPTIITETVVTIPETITPETKEDTPKPIEEPEETPIEETSDVPEIAENSSAQAMEEIVEAPAPATTFDHALFDSLLVQHISSQGNVNYDGMKSNWGSLRAYIKSLSNTLPTDAWAKEEKLAYWMNAYNAMTIDLILRNYPLESIKDIKNPWDQRFWKLGDKWYNLNEIEHKILRKMGDARIHFGINCASFSCPPLLNEAFTAGNVDSKLDMLSRKFINDSTRNTITTNRVDVSKIFTWFAKDFKTDGSLIDFLNKYSETTIAPNAKVRYLDYDWNLNK